MQRHESNCTYLKIITRIERQKTFIMGCVWNGFLGLTLILSMDDNGMIVTRNIENCVSISHALYKCRVGFG